ncbi:MAG: hypothetical protein ABIP74_00170 [Candidatus Saccharimonas sp.]
MSQKLTQFTISDTPNEVQFVETQTVKEGVECDIYTFVGDDSRDLAIVRVLKGYKTPLQRILLGTKTIEGFADGEGTLMVRSDDGTEKSYTPSSFGEEVIVEVGQIMQWHAGGESDLTFYEICEPPYADGRFENLSE